MDARHLETFVWVIRLGGIGAAARQLNLTQPTITRRIQELERDLRTPLFRREGRKTVPTPVGRVCLANAERVLAEVAAMRVAASGRSAMCGTVRAGVTELIALTWFDRLLVRLAEAYPHVTVEMDVDLSSRLVAGLARRRLDIAFLPGPLPVPGVVQVEVGSCSFRWMAAPSLLCGQHDLSPTDVATLPIIMLPSDADIHGAVVRWFDAAGVKPRRISLCNSFGVVASLVRKGLGISPLPVDMFAEDLASGALVAIPEYPPLDQADYSAAYLRSHELSILPEIAAFAREASWFSRRV